MEKNDLKSLDDLKNNLTQLEIEREERTLIRYIAQNNISSNQLQQIYIQVITRENSEKGDDINLGTYLETLFDLGYPVNRIAEIIKYLRLREELKKEFLEILDYFNFEPGAKTLLVEAIFNPRENGMYVISQCIGDEKRDILTIRAENNANILFGKGRRIEPEVIADYIDRIKNFLHMRIELFFRDEEMINAFLLNNMGKIREIKREAQDESEIDKQILAYLLESIKFDVKFIDE